MNPRHAGPLTPPGNPTPALFRQTPALCGHPRHCTVLCGKASVNSVTLCRLLPYDRHAAPSKEDGGTLEKGRDTSPTPSAGWRCDIRPVECVSTVTSGTVRPSPPLCCHPGHYNTHPDAVRTWDNEMSPRLLLCALRPSVNRTLESARGRRPNGESPHDHPRSRSWAGTGHTMTPDGSEIRQDDHQFRGIVRHTATRS
jgi:hypothetical protein